MARRDGWTTQLTKQVGEYLVAAELCRRGFQAVTFAGNVPNYDILAVSASGKLLVIQVKTIKAGDWQISNVRDFLDIRLEGKKQIIEGLKPCPHPDLVCVLVRLHGQGMDEFYILTWEELQRIIFEDYRKYLERQSGVRQKRHDSFHARITVDMVKAHRDKWEVIEHRLR